MFFTRLSRGHLRLAQACLGSKLQPLPEAMTGLLGALLKHVLQYTGLPGVGLKGTVVA
jgi:hypothetical protein